MTKVASFSVEFDAAGDLRWILRAGNGHEICRSTDSMYKRKNSERSLDRLKSALQEIKDDDIIEAVLEFRQTALKAYVEKGPGRGYRTASRSRPRVA